MVGGGSLGGLYGKSRCGRCGRCGNIKQGVHSHQHCTALMAERSLLRRGYVPFLGNLRKLAKLAKVSMVRGRYEGNEAMPRKVRSLRKDSEARPPTALYGPVWAVSLWRRRQVKHTSMRRPQTRQFIYELRSVGRDPRAQCLIAGEESLGGSSLAEASRYFLHIYENETVNSLVAVRCRQLQAMRAYEVND
jgi:hypothetical protein